MILDNIKNIENYKDFSKIYPALDFLNSLDLKSLSKEKIVISENCFANYIELISKPHKECVFEAHKKYIDIHFIISGVEGIATRYVDKLESINDFNYDKDIGFYKGNSNNISYLQKGDFMVCFPQDAHMVAMMKIIPNEIEKIVVKITY